MDKRSKGARCWARSKFSSLHASLITTNFLLNRLIEPCLDTSRPLLVKVLERDYWNDISQKKKWRAWAFVIRIVFQRKILSSIFKKDSNAISTAAVFTNRCCASPSSKIPRYICRSVVSRITQGDGEDLSKSSNKIIIEAEEILGTGEPSII